MKKYSTCTVQYHVQFQGTKEQQKSCCSIKALHKQLKSCFSTQKFKAFSIFINTLSRAIAVTFAVCGATEKLARFFHHFTNGRFVLAIQPGNLHLRFFFYFNHIQNIYFLTNGKDITASLRLRSTTSITTLTLWGHD